VASPDLRSSWHSYNEAVESRRSRLPAIHAKASNNSIAATVPKLSGRTPTLPCSGSHARQNAVDLAAHTGLRLGDQLRVSWSHIGDDAIVIATSKSRQRQQAIIPLYDELRAILACIPKRATTILTNTNTNPQIE